MRQNRFSIEGVMCLTCVDAILDAFGSLREVDRVRIEVCHDGPYVVSLVGRAAIAESVVVAALEQVGFRLPVGTHARSSRLRTVEVA